MKNLWRCTECEHTFAFAEAQRAEHPFNSNATVYGCPKCGEIEGWEELCEVDGCSERATSGTPLKDRSGYIRCCYRHFEEQQDKPTHPKIPPQGNPQGGATCL
jgi:hypothetical protein